MKTIGTLEEIGAQVGDVVEWLGVNGRTKDYVSFEIIKIENGFYHYVCSNCGSFIARNEPFRIVKRATKSPVRTVTKKEIVPGVYGKLSVHQLRPDNGGYYMALVENTTHKESIVHAAMTASDLTAAIATLTEIRDAMQEND